MMGDTLRELFARLPLPAVVAPMTLVSTPSLVAAGCNAGIVGSFPTSNAASAAQLDEWLDEIGQATAGNDAAGPVMANLIVGRQNERLDQDVACVIARGVPLVVTSVGSPAPVIGPLHEAGCLVWADVASIDHVDKSLEVGADGLVLLGAGAGGHTGWANPLAFVRAVRAITDVPLAAAGGMSDGAALWAAVVAGYDAGWFGTRFIATPESGAPQGWRDAIVASTMDDIVVDSAPNGVGASFLRDRSGSGGHTVSAVEREMPTADVVASLVAEWNAARAVTARLLAEIRSTRT